MLDMLDTPMQESLLDTPHTKPLSPLLMLPSLPLPLPLLLSPPH